MVDGDYGVNGGAVSAIQLLKQEQRTDPGRVTALLLLVLEGSCRA